MTPKAPIHLNYVVDVDRLIVTYGFQAPGLDDPDVQKVLLLCRYWPDRPERHLVAAARGKSRAAVADRFCIGSHPWVLVEMVTRSLRGGRGDTNGLTDRRCNLVFAASSVDGDALAENEVGN